MGSNSPRVRIPVSPPDRTWNFFKMSELPTSKPVESSEHELSGEELAEVSQHLGEEAAELTVLIDTSEPTVDNEKKSADDTVNLIDDYKAEHNSVHGLSMKKMVEKGFDPDMVLLKLGSERLEENLITVNNIHRAERGTPEWNAMERLEARSIPIEDDEIDALMDAGVNPQHIVDALQRTEPEDGVDNPSSARIVRILDKLVDAGLPPAIIAARLNPSWREGTKDQLAAAEVRWNEANYRKAAA